MRILLFLLCFCFSGIFFFFSKADNWISQLDSIFFSPIIVALFFFFFGITCFLYFSPTKPISLNQWPTESLLNIPKIREILHLFVTKYMYYIGIALFYIALYFVFLSFGGWAKYFPYLLLVLNIGVILLFFITHKFSILRDILKINTITFSCFYILYYTLSLLTGAAFFISIDLVNTTFIFLLFFLLFFFETPKEKRYISDPIVTLYFVLYTFIVCLFYGSFFISSLLLWMSFWTAILGLLVFYVPESLHFFRNSLKLLRSIGVIFTCCSLSFSFLYIYAEGLSFFSVFIIVVLSIFNGRIHFLYQNYLSLFFSYFAIFFLFSYTHLSHVFVWSYKEIILLLNYGIISSSLILYTYIYQLQYTQDVYFIHSFAYVVNIFWITTFFLFVWFDILFIWIILFFESIFILSSYYKLNTLHLWQK